MAPDTNFKLMSYNPFTVTDNFFNSVSNPDINIQGNISPLDTKYFIANEICEGFECICKNGFSVLHVNISSINKNFDTFKNFYSKLNCKFSMVCFSETWTTDNSICNDSNFQKENYTVLYQVRESGRGGGLSIFVHKEVYSKPRTDLSINSNDQQSLCIEIHHKKDKSILFSVMYRPPNGDTTVFENFCKNLLSANDEISKSIFLLITGIQRRSGIKKP